MFLLYHKMMTLDGPKEKSLLNTLLFFSHILSYERQSHFFVSKCFQFGPKFVAGEGLNIEVVNTVKG